MMNILILILIAIVITAVTAKLKEGVDYLLNAFKVEGVKSGYVIALILGVASGLAFQIGTVESVLQLTGTPFEFSEWAKYMDIAFSCVLLSAGSGAFIGIVEKYRGDASQVVDGEK